MAYTLKEKFSGLLALVGLPVVISKEERDGEGVVEEEMGTESSERRWEQIYCTTVRIPYL